MLYFASLFAVYALLVALVSTLALERIGHRWARYAILVGLAGALPGMVGLVAVMSGVHGWAFGLLAKGMAAAGLAGLGASLILFRRRRARPV